MLDDQPRGASLRYLRTILGQDGPVYPTANDWIEANGDRMFTDGKPVVGDICCWTSTSNPGFVALVVGIDLILVWHQGNPLVTTWKNFGPPRNLDFVGYVKGWA